MASNNIYGDSFSEIIYKCLSGKNIDGSELEDKSNMVNPFVRFAFKYRYHHDGEDATIEYTLTSQGFANQDGGIGYNADFHATLNEVKEYVNKNKLGNVREHIAKELRNEIIDLFRDNHIFNEEFGRVEQAYYEIKEAKEDNDEPKIEIAKKYPIDGGWYHYKFRNDATMVQRIAA